MSLTLLLCKDASIIANALGLQHVLLTVDEALYCKMMELKWAVLESSELTSVMETFVASKVNFSFGWSYMQMVQILLFSFMPREMVRGNSIFVHFSIIMLPLFMKYDHTNYACWGTIYLNKMHQLPVEVQQVFESGNFVVKRSNQKLILTKVKNG